MRFLRRVACSVVCVRQRIIKASDAGSSCVVLAAAFSVFVRCSFSLSSFFAAAFSFRFSLFLFQLPRGVFLQRGADKAKLIAKRPAVSCKSLTY